MRRTKTTEIHRKTGNLRLVQLRLGHTKVDSMLRFLGIEVALEPADAAQSYREPMPPDAASERSQSKGIGSRFSGTF